MAQESCNLDKDEPELLKPSSSSPPTNTAPPAAAAAPSPAIFLKSSSPSPSSQEQHHQLQQQQQLVARVEAPNPNPTTNCISSSSCTSRKRKLETSPPSPPPLDADGAVLAFSGCDAKAQKVDSTARPGVNRCCCCQKKVGLTGFRCRCGDLFCARHRYSDAHGCSFDYKAAGRAEISKANPVVRAPKIIKI